MSSSRHHGMMGALPISINEMSAYCQMFHISELEDRVDFVRIMQKLDGAYLAVMAERHDSETKVEVVNDRPLPDNGEIRSK